MNQFFRRVISITTGGLLVVLLAVSAAVAVANSGTGSDGTKTISGNTGTGSDDSGDNNHTCGYWCQRAKERQKAEAEAKAKAEAEAKRKAEERGKSEDRRRDGTGTLPNPGTPKQGKTVNVDPGNGKGTVNIMLPGAAKSVPLEKISSVPVGSVVDTLHGQVTLTTVPLANGTKQSATFSGAIFKVLQSKTGAPITGISLRGGNFASCKRPFARRSLVGRLFGSMASISKSKAHKVRSLWGRGKGHFRTRGRNGAATVRGTIWLTEDRCDGTLVRVRRGVVGVRDFAKKKTLTVRAGHSYFARRSG